MCSPNGLCIGYFDARSCCDASSFCCVAALAFIDARVVDEYPGGDHAIFIGQVEALGTGSNMAFANTSEEEPINRVSTEQDETAPLIFYEGRYRHLATKYSAPAVAPQVEYNGNIEKPVH